MNEKPSSVKINTYNTSSSCIFLVVAPLLLIGLFLLMSWLDSKFPHEPDWLQWVTYSIFLFLAAGIFGIGREIRKLLKTHKKWGCDHCGKIVKIDDDVLFINCQSCNKEMSLNIQKLSGAQKHKQLQSGTKCVSCGYPNKLSDMPGWFECPKCKKEVIVSKLYLIVR